MVKTLKIIGKSLLVIGVIALFYLLLISPTYETVALILIVVIIDLLKDWITGDYRPIMEARRVLKEIYLSVKYWILS